MGFDGVECIYVGNVVQVFVVIRVLVWLVGVVGLVGVWCYFEKGGGDFW